ncbi:MAG: anthranilate synthase component I family protein [Clostridiaceae bacterium]|jgi:anthranilate synthase component 1|nr:anthranilate synthase component I family protein [Clostridiaceae bacterium]
MHVVKPSLAEVKKYAEKFPCCPVYRRIPESTREPLEVFQALKRLSRQCYVLESLEEAGDRGRYTFLGYDPKLEIACSDGNLSIKNGASIEIKTDAPGGYINKILEDNRAPDIGGLPPFAGGLLGYFAYDYIKYREKSLKLDAADGEKFKDVDLMLFDKVIAYDHERREILLIVNIRTDAVEENYNRAKGELDHLERIVKTGETEKIPGLKLKSPFRALFGQEAYCGMVRAAKERIHEGDIFQAVLSNSFYADAEGSLFGAYRILREINPSPYMFYLSSDKLEIAGASPETLVRLRGKAVATFPLAGTRRRGRDAEEDAALERELLADEKELAEHNMLVDLGRNDVGRVSKFGSVRVEKYLGIERFSHVMHIGSTVTGELKDGETALSALEAVLPAGTLSGAPKLKALEIINGLENNKRGVYGGAIGYLSFSGNMDTCIAIRIAYKKNGRVFVRSGAGIVADSVPEKEYEECVNKAKAVLNALERSAEGNE